MEKVYDVIGVENPIMDFAVSIDRLPKTDSMSVMHDYLWQSGGNASSAIAALARLGAKCSMLGVVGTDEFGTFCRDDMVRHGVDVSHLYTQEGGTTFTICLAEEETKGRSFLGKMGVNGPLTDVQVDESYIAGARYIHTSMIECSAKKRAVELARKNGVLVSADGGAYTAEADFLVTNSDILIISEEFYGALFDDGNYVENCRRLIEKGPQIVIVTLGSKGCAGADRSGNTFRLPPFSGHKIVDTTGAGDVFHGGFLYAHSQGWELEYCARFASAVSYINCTSLGGRVGIPDRAMVEQFLKDNTIDYSGIEPRKAFYRSVMKFNKTSEHSPTSTGEGRRRLEIAEY